ncbi:MAG TPA: CPBP family intramembrane glutamic endopeptidase [Phycisphaerae bacterium]|nr:CPBP family intramembrane glutamic endopeptidase [Phycisphaerae bacterium]
MNPHTVEAINIGVHAVGALTALVLLVQLFRSGRWRDPLAEHGWTHRGPHLLHAAAAFLLYLILAQILIAALEITFDTDAMLNKPGSLDWYAVAGAGATAQLLTCALMVVILAARRPFAGESSRRVGLAGALWVGLVAALVVIPLCTVQLQMDQVAWKWLRPDAVPPVHPTMQALHDSEWDWRGPVQLFVVALAVAPVYEELFFRGVLLGGIWTATRRTWVAVGLSGLLFGLMHVGQPQTVLPLVTMGVVLGYVRVRYRSLTACVLAHSLFNARTMVMLYLAPELLTPGS